MWYRAGWQWHSLPRDGGDGGGGSGLRGIQLGPERASTGYKAAAATATVAAHACCVNAGWVMRLQMAEERRGSQGERNTAGLESHATSDFSTEPMGDSRRDNSTRHMQLRATDGKKEQKKGSLERQVCLNCGWLARKKRCSLAPVKAHTHVPKKHSTPIHQT